MNQYQAFYKKRKLVVHANNSYEAQRVAAGEFKAKRRFEVVVMLIKKGGGQVTHTADF